MAQNVSEKSKSIQVVGAKQNNLKNINVSLPLFSFTAVCGPSGSGKSSLAFETLYSEGQRRYIESLSNYAKQFIKVSPKPDVEKIENIPPTLAIEQKNAVKSSRSSVATITEIADSLRILFERLATVHCPKHKLELKSFSPVQASQSLIQTWDQKRVYILSPVLKKKRVLKKKFLKNSLMSQGFVRVFIPTAKKNKKDKFLGEVKRLEELSEQELEKDFFIIIDRLMVNSSEEPRLIDAFLQSYRACQKYNEGVFSQALVLNTEGETTVYGERASCKKCDYQFPVLKIASLFSFNHPLGACQSCQGFGYKLEVDPKKVIPNEKLSLSQGAISPFAMPSATYDRKELYKFCKKAKISLEKPWKDLKPQHRKAIWEGNKSFYGVLGYFEDLEEQRYKMHVRIFLARFKGQFVCSACEGAQLRKEALQVFLKGKSFHGYMKMTLEELDIFLNQKKFSNFEEELCKEVLSTLRKRVYYLNRLGLSYLSLNRLTKTLSGGEYQRIHLANQLGQGLSQVLYVLDEPTVGLHPRDTDRLIKILHELKNLGNTILIVEHDEAVIKSSSHVLEMGPNSGRFGGEVLLFQKTKDFLNNKESLTASYIRKENKDIINPRPTVIKDYKKILEIKGCQGHNLKNVDLKIPLNRFVVVSGVSGSGKSSLISKTLYPALKEQLQKASVQGLSYKSLKGFHFLSSVSLIDQSPVGKTLRSMPVTYLKAYDLIRNLFASTRLAGSYGFRSGDFSLNVDGGRCPICRGLGYKSIDMVFVDPIKVECEECKGLKFKKNVLEIRFNGKNINDVLAMTVREAMEFFSSQPSIWRQLAVLKKVGLDYIGLGQSTFSLSGGETQRLKIAKELLFSSSKNNLYIMDEPSKGLHFKEVFLLLNVVNQLIKSGSSVLMVEHNLELIKRSDYIVEIGPEAGKYGGEIVAAAPTLDFMENFDTLTAEFLKKSDKSS